MTTPIRAIETDVCIVGAGLIGLVHALEARRRGLTVVVLERDRWAAGASIRGSGHLFFSALATGAALDGAVLARQRWIDLLRRIGHPGRAGGTLIVARHGDELGLLEAAASEPARLARVLSPREVCSVAPVAPIGLRGGWHAPGDLLIDVRSTARGLARLLASDPGARLEWGCPVHDVEAGVVHAGSLRVGAPAIVLCPGPGLASLPPALRPATTGALVSTRTQRLALAAPTGRRGGPVLGTALSLLRHPGLAAAPEAQAMRRRLELERPELIDAGVSPLLAPLPGGDLLVGEARSVAAGGVVLAGGDAFLSERAAHLMLDQVEELIGARPPVRRRWASTELCAAESDLRDVLVAAPAPGVRVVLDISGRGVAVAPARAARVLDDLLLTPGLAEIERAGAETIVVADARPPGLRRHADAFRNPGPPSRAPGR